MKQFKIEGLPPRINEKFVSRRFVLSAKYRDYLEHARLQVPHQIPCYERGVKLDVELAFHLHRERDIDSSIKPVLDALEGRCYENDMDIVHLVCVKVVDKTLDVGVEVEIGRYYED